jgi:hypothetical protein
MTRMPIRSLRGEEGDREVIAEAHKGLIEAKPGGLDGIEEPGACLQAWTRRFLSDSGLTLTHHAYRLTIMETMNPRNREL